MNQTLPVVGSTGDLAAEVALFWQQQSSPHRLSDLVRRTVLANLQDGANMFHAEVIGAILAGAIEGSPQRGLYSPQMLLVKWNAAFEEHPKSVYDLGVHGAYAFSLCLLSIYRTNTAKSANVGALLKYLEDSYPLPDAGVFDARDIT